jgi:hypothetical protein
MKTNLTEEAGLSIGEKQPVWMIKLEEIRLKCSQCSSIEQFLQLYDRLDVATQYIRVSMGLRSPEEWAADWAIRFRLANDSESVKLNEQRKTILALIYRLVDCLMDPSCEDVTFQSVEKNFKLHRVMNLLQLAVPMDRAQCLYKMQYVSSLGQPNNVPSGMHWVAQSHVSESKRWSDLLEEVGGRPTINKRLIFLHTAFPELRDSPSLSRWLTPQLALSW